MGTASFDRLPSDETYITVGRVAVQVKHQPAAQARVPITHVARAREKFLSDDDLGDDRLDGAVRDAISTSWRRSRSFKVQADRLELPFVREPNTDSP